MFHGPPLPLHSHLPIRSLLAHARTADPLGAWARVRAPELRTYAFSFRQGGRVLVSSDLGLLLGRCAKVALREGEHTRVLPAETVIRWRALQVATATPHLPGIRHLAVEFPGMRVTVEGLLIPIGSNTAEAALAGCVAAGARVAGSRIVYLPPLHLPPLPAPP